MLILKKPNDLDRFDRAMETAREKMINAILSWPTSTSVFAEDLRDDAIDYYAALVALRARYEEHELEDRRHTPTWCSRCERLTAEAKRLFGEDA